MELYNESDGTDQLCQTASRPDCAIAEKDQTLNITVIDSNILMVLYLQKAFDGADQKSS